MTPSNIHYIFIHIWSCIHITYTHKHTCMDKTIYCNCVDLINIHSTRTKPQAHWRVHTETNNILYVTHYTVDIACVVLFYVHAHIYIIDIQ